MKHALSLWNGLKPLREAFNSTDMFPSDLFFCHSHVILGFMGLLKTLIKAKIITKITEIPISDRP